MNKKIYCLLFFIFLVFCVPSSAHQDRIVTIEDGTLSGLPKKYQPAYLDLDKKILQIKNNRFNFPPCVSKYFPKNDQYDVQITSSWYHDLSSLPPYLSISIHPKNKDYKFNLSFNMDTLEPIGFEIEIRESDVLTSFHQLEISDNCRQSIQDSYSKEK